jgi:hypothetical protein
MVREAGGVEAGMRALEGQIQQLEGTLRQIQAIPPGSRLPEHEQMAVLTKDLLLINRAGLAAFSCRKTGH